MVSKLQKKRLEDAAFRAGVAWGVFYNLGNKDANVITVFQPERIGLTQ